jgi:hypothetical protein
MFSGEENFSLNQRVARFRDRKLWWRAGERPGERAGEQAGEQGGRAGRANGQASRRANGQGRGAARRAAGVPTLRDAAVRSAQHAVDVRGGHWTGQ